MRNSVAIECTPSMAFSCGIHSESCSLTSGPCILNCTIDGEYVSAVETRSTSGIELRARLARRRVQQLLAIVLFVLGALGYKGWRVYDRLQLVRADLRAIQAAAGAQRDSATLESLGVLLAKTRSDTAA